MECDDSPLWRALSILVEPEAKPGGKFEFFHAEGL
jgi:hypothetical protein